MESSQRNLYIDMVFDRLIFSNNEITFTPCFIHNPHVKQVWDYLEQGLVFTVLNAGF